MNPTTLSDVLIDLLMHGADRGALVTQPREGLPVGVMVLMLSDAALRKLGAPLRGLLAEMEEKNAPSAAPDFTPLRCSEDAVLVEFYRAAYPRLPRGWGWFGLRFGKVNVTATLTFGRSWCERVAQICNAAGAPCSLDPEKAAPGYELERRMHRN